MYDYPINQAAQKLGVGVTVLKKYCRKFAIPRWPYRKLKSMEKLIDSVNEYATQDPIMTQVQAPPGCLPLHPACPPASCCVHLRLCHRRHSLAVHVKCSLDSYLWIMTS